MDVDRARIASERVAPDALEQLVARQHEAAMVEALLRSYDGPLNVVGPGAASPWQAVRLGGRTFHGKQIFKWIHGRGITDATRDALRDG